MVNIQFDVDGELPVMAVGAQVVGRNTSDFPTAVTIGLERNSW
jgi:hypothetical protein